MGHFVKVNGDYNIKTGDGAKITLDTGPAAAGGSVRVTGNLVVEGDTFNISTTNLTVEDNIISLNTGEVGPGVSLTYSGIEVQRGDTTSITPQNNANILYDESIDSWIFAHGSAPGPFNFDQSAIKIRKIVTNSATDDGDLLVIGSGTGVIKVIGTSNYEDQITHDDDIPNKKYVDDAIQNQPTFQIVAPQSQDTRVVIADKEITPNLASQPGSLAYFTATTTYSTFGESAVSIIVDNELVSQFYDDYMLVGNPGVNGIEIDGTNFEIRTETSITDQNIFVKTAGTGKLQTNYAFQLDKIGTVPTYVSNSVLLYAAQPGIGTTGVWFQNDGTVVSRRNGELISKNKALVFSMLF